MQAEGVVDAFSWACIALWGAVVDRKIDARTKYKNGAVHVAKIGNPHKLEEIWEELEEHLVSPQKKYVGGLGARSRQGYLRCSTIPVEGEVDTYDIHVDSATNLYLLANGMITHNSGKSAIGRRILATMLREDAESGWTRPKHWKGPLLFAFVGKNHKQMVDDWLAEGIKALPTDIDIAFDTAIYGQVMGLDALIMEGGNRFMKAYDAWEQNLADMGNRWNYSRTPENLKRICIATADAYRRQAEKLETRAEGIQI
jgi:hypothetical protein